MKRRSETVVAAGALFSLGGAVLGAIITYVGSPNVGLGIQVGAAVSSIAVAALARAATRIALDYFGLGTVNPGPLHFPADVPKQAIEARNAEEVEVEIGGTTEPPYTPSE